MDEANAAGFRNDDKGDMVVEADNVDSRATFFGLVDEGIVVLPGANRHHFFGYEGPNDILRRLLSESDTLNAKSGIAKEGGDKISAGNFS